MPEEDRIEKERRLLVYILQNEFLTVRFDERARLIYLRNNKGGRGNILASPAEYGFKMVFRKGQDWEKTAFLKDRSFTVIQDGNRIEFMADRLQTRDGMADIGLKLSVQLKDEELMFDAEIKSREDGPITDFEYPVVGEIKSLAGGKPALLWPNQSGEKYNNIGEYLAGQKPTRMPSRQSLSITWPGTASMQWMALVDKMETLYLAGHDADFHATELRAVGGGENPGAVTLVMNKMPFIRKGEQWTGPTSLLKLYTGSWHHGAQDYMDWSKTWRPVYEKPQWVKNMTGYFIVICKQQYGTELWRYQELPKLYELALAHGCDTLGVYGWQEGGHDNRYPETKISESLGGAQVLRDNIKAVQDRGGHVTLYVQGRLMDITTDYYQNGGFRFESKNRWGMPCYEEYNKAQNSSFLKEYSHKVFSVACPSCPEWQELMKEKADLIASFGPDGILYDQIGGMPPRICFDKSHPHEKGKESLSTTKGTTKLLGGLQAHMKGTGKGFALFSDHITDVYSSYVDCLHGIDSCPGREGSRMETGMDPEKAEKVFFPELFRYCFPDVPVTVCNPYPYITKRAANYAITFGFLNEVEVRYQTDREDILADAWPACREYVKKVTELRKKYEDILGYGWFQDELPILSKNPAILAKAFARENKLAAVLWNDTDRESKMNIEVPGYRLTEVSTVNGTLEKLPETLQPQQIAVALYEKEQQE